MQLRSGNILKSSSSMTSAKNTRDYAPMNDTERAKLQAFYAPYNTMLSIPSFTKTNTNEQNTHIYFDYSSDSTYEYESDYDDSDDESYVSESFVNTKPFDNTHPKYEEWIVRELLNRINIVNNQTQILDRLRAIGELTHILNEEIEFISKMSNYENFVTNVLFNKYAEILEELPKAVLNELTDEEIKEHAIFIFDVQNELIQFNNKIQSVYNRLL